MINVDLSEIELNARKEKWQKQHKNEYEQEDYRSGALWRYAQNVGSARFGAVTHPGAKREKKCYADI